MEKKIRFLTKNIRNKDPHEILLVSKSSLRGHEKMLECLCFNTRIYWSYNDDEELTNFWTIPDFVPYLEVMQVE